MKRSTIRTVEDILRDYPKIDKLIKAREEELRHPIKQEDDNVGGGRSSMIGDSVTTVLIKLEEDGPLNLLKRKKNAVQECYASSDEDTQVIIKELYFKKRPRLSVEGIVANGLVNCSRSSAFLLKREFIEKCAKMLGIY